MTSTENLLQDSDKSTNTLESGYHSEGREDGLPRPQHKEKASKKKKPHRYEGLENKGFVPVDNEYLDISVKHRAPRTSIENTAPQMTTEDAESREVHRRHSYAGQSTVDTTQIVDGGSQNASTNRRRSSTADEDLRRRACYNSMRLRRTSSSSSQPPPSEVEVSVDDDVFRADSRQTGTRKKQQGESREMREVDRVYSMGSLCSAVELENKKMDEYSRRLSFALEERAKLEQELKTLRRTATVASMPAEENWKISTQIHYRNEKYNSERRLSSRGNVDKQFSIEQLKRIQLEQSRNLPDAPGAGEEVYEEVCRPRPGISENDSEIARLAEGSIPTTSGVKESKRKLAKEKPLARSESESSLERTDAFRRNQRRPLRYKRASTSTESLTGATKPSTSTNESKTNKPQQEKPEKLEGIRSTEAVSQNHSKWFDYMLPPGKRGNRPVTQHASQQEIAANTLSLPEKVRYYQELQEKRSREDNSFDLADAFMAAEDAEAEKEFQRKAAGEAAILRREASRLLWQAMNLERICDPNARVRHIFTPY
ncbi:hypothetical protein OS493_011593 [Desmophyllum pertusum]|uniref:Uncharacterized protein n=1 Tax=Desmophyllum pertusum TaxID=174260 RepID=A0A9X0CL21_9CNID|nr:hypothetical protein OS493_011593 [Desmophyllum pertusum]